jgi:hypothetical protein
MHRNLEQIVAENRLRSNGKVKVGKALFEHGWRMGGCTAFRLNQECQKEDDKQPERTGDGKFSNYFLLQAHVIYIGIKFRNFRTLSAYLVSSLRAVQKYLSQ